MTFDEILLYEAVHDVYRTVQNPRSDTWVREPLAEKLCRFIQNQLPLDSPYTSRQMIDAWCVYGKSTTANDAQQKKVELVVLTARAHGKKCFYANRGKGECSNEVTIDRLVPGVRGGLYVVENTVIACSFHNSQRSDDAIEAYLAKSRAPERLL